jgi:hypothetical protein
LELLLSEASLGFFAQLHLKFESLDIPPSVSSPNMVL